MFPRSLQNLHSGRVWVTPAVRLSRRYIAWTLTDLVRRQESTSSFRIPIMAQKRKRSSVSATHAAGLNALPGVDLETRNVPPLKSNIPIKLDKATSRKPTRGQRPPAFDTNPDDHTGVVDGQAALRASPDADAVGESFAINKAVSEKGQTPILAPAVKREDTDSPLSELGEGHLGSKAPKMVKRTPTKSSIAAKKGSDEIKAFIAEQKAKKAAEKPLKNETDDGTMRADPDGDDAAPAEDPDAVRREARRPPPVHSDYLPLPWKGRLGYACLNTYLRLSTPPIFSSRTCRIASIIEHRHPLKDPSLPEHATKNRPDKDQPADIARGKRYVEELGLANARDIPKMLRWNEKYGIRFLRLSSEMFPFASHDEYGYTLAPFASETLAEAGKVAAELGHRLTTHPGQFTQLGSPRPEVIKNAIRDLVYHDEMLSLLRLPSQEDRDAVMILHLGGTFGDKAATLDRFRENYKRLSKSVKNRLVLENDDVSWSVHDLLPLCEELNIPLVLDFHHHNIVFDATQLREGTQDITELFPRIKATWDRKKIRQKMHYSEPTPPAVTGRQRRKHNPRPATLPPCQNDMDLMIEAKDKEQAVFELMRTFKLPGWDTFNDIVPYERDDDNKPAPKRAKKKKTKKQIAAEIDEFGRELSEEEEVAKAEVPVEDIGMGGPQSRVYWPPGMEEWLRPKKREVKKKTGDDLQEPDTSTPTPQNFAARLLATRQREAIVTVEMKEKIIKAGSVKEVQAILEEIKAAVPLPALATAATKDDGGDGNDEKPVTKRAKTAPVKKNTAAKTTAVKRRTVVRSEATASSSEDDGLDELSLPDTSADESIGTLTTSKKAVPARMSRRTSAKKVVYTEDDD